MFKEQLLWDWLKCQDRTLSGISDGGSGPHSSIKSENQIKMLLGPMRSKQRG